MTYELLILFLIRFCLFFVAVVAEVKQYILSYIFVFFSILRHAFEQEHEQQLQLERDSRETDSDYEGSDLLDN